MKAHTVIDMIRSLVLDTFRQSLASQVFWLVLGASGLCILFCGSVSLQGYTAIKPAGEIEYLGADRKPFTGLNPGRGYLSLGFGAVRVELFRDGEAEILFLQVLLAVAGAGLFGTLLALMWTSGLVPDFLQTHSASVLLAKPVPRWCLLVGKCLGVLALVAFQLLVFIGGTWLALGLRTGFWFPGYLLSIPLVLLNFAILYSFSVVLAVWTRNTIVCLVGAVLLWMACSAVDVERQTLAVQASGVSAPAWLAAEAGYWLLPKPADLSYLLHQSLGAERHLAALPSMAAADRAGFLSPTLSVLTSLLFTAALLGLAALRFSSLDY